MAHEQYPQDQCVTRPQLLSNPGWLLQAADSGRTPVTSAVMAVFTPLPIHVPVALAFLMYNCKQREQPGQMFKNACLQI